MTSQAPLVFPESPSMTVAAIHLTVNEPVLGTRPGKVNRDLDLRDGVFSTLVR